MPQIILLKIHHSAENTEFRPRWEYLKLSTAKQAKLEATEANIAFTNALLKADWVKKIDSESEDGKLLVWGTKKIR